MTAEPIEKTEQDYENECNLIDLMFPNAKFSIAIDIEELDDIITTQPKIIIKSSYNCYCYEICKRTTEYFIISGKNITNKYIINELINQGLHLDCDHRFVEGFHNPSSIKSDCQFEIMTGS
jgi:hypothetical protein